MSDDGKRNSGAGAGIGAGQLVSKPCDDRKTFCTTSAGKKVVIKSADMKEDMQKEAIEIAVAAFEKNSVEKDVAEQIKKEFDNKYGLTWHCIVGRNFGIIELLNPAKSAFKDWPILVIIFVLLLFYLRILSLIGFFVS